MEPNQVIENDSEKSEKTSTSVEDDIMKLFENELKDYRQVFEFIRKLQELVERQRKLLHKYHERFKQIKKEVQHVAIQTDTDDMLKESMPTNDRGGIDINSFKEEIVQAAHSAVQKSGFVYEPVSGLYYDYNTGYYYNSELGLYYDGNTSSYYYYNEQEKKFEFHSQVQPTQQASNNQSVKTKQDAVKPQLNSTSNVGLGASGEVVGASQGLVTPLPDTDMLSDVSSSSDLPDEPEDVEKKDVNTNQTKQTVSEGSDGEEGEIEEDREDGELSTDEDIEMETDETQDTVGKYRTPLEYYNSQEYRTWYDNYCKSVTVQYRKTPVAYDPTSEEAKNVNPALRTEEYEIANAWPPCLRIMVTETSVKGLQPGTLFLVTYLGGTIGREGEHAVLIPDINISKHHAKIEFTGTESHKDDPSKGYTLVDLGSRNGTYVDNVRLSSALQESEPHLLKHGTELRIGSTKLSVHIHNGRDTCDQCEPGVLISAMNKPVVAKIDLSASSGQNRQAELKRLRKKFGLDKKGANTGKMETGYEDRAERRRKTVIFRSFQIPSTLDSCGLCSIMPIRSILKRDECFTAAPYLFRSHETPALLDSCGLCRRMPIL
ncbi:angiogenic factor with G patch and FHA domains 1 [Diaphorina citri]|uniref:Angiogenic factor with G patch and FHA domains 1 n=1 Tax=Diaphorina citri TaxID=121845 RepID=A0A3Q0ISK3_DIACI|nr:angiogenic factor with G patch and FHA domains 1 [Diaphorina citri]